MSIVEKIISMAEVFLFAIIITMILPLNIDK
ncbi:MAG: hypothetical protein R3Y64_00960 [Peptostreptococcaceae bacterium]